VLFVDILIEASKRRDQLGRCDQIQRILPEVSRPRNRGDGWSIMPIKRPSTVGTLFFFSFRVLDDREQLF
jgi:hypothetical protein